MNAPVFLVSVVIPTRNRPRMVLAAVKSALAQTYAPVEVIVVVDGPEEVADEHTAAVLAAVTDRRLRVVMLPASVGGSEARNLGVRAARGEWVALLDDDDLWLPEKLAVQMGQALALPAGLTPVVSCRVLARSPDWEEVWPRRVFAGDESLSEYLFCRKGWGYGSALLQTSTLLAPRELLLRVHFARGLRKHQDWDWLLRAVEEPCVQVCFAGREPLAVFHVEGERWSVGRVRDWRFSLGWALERKHLLTQRAFAGFLAMECAAQAQGQGLKAQMELLLVCLRNGMPRGGEAARFLVFLWVPRGLRRSVRGCVRGYRNGSWRGALLFRRFAVRCSWIV